MKICACIYYDIKTNKFSATIYSGPYLKGHPYQMIPI